MTAANIKFDVNIFSFAGTLAGGVTCSGTADKFKSTTNRRWFNNGDGTITDTRSGLTWLQNAGASLGGASWHVANIVAGKYAGESINRRWRLPTAYELFALTNGYDPILCLETAGNTCIVEFFTSIKNDYYWSSSVVDDTNAYCVSLGTAGIAVSQAMTNNNYIWPVHN